MSSKIRFATITINTASFQDPSADLATPIAQSTLEATGAFELAAPPSYLPEDSPDKFDAQLKAKLLELGDKGDVDLVFTIGCTGFGPRERSPEVVKSLITRDAPGLVHLMLTASFQKTPYAAVSRPAAGIYKDRVLMITLPGGSKAVRENIEALVGSEVLQRCVRYMEGGRHVKDVQK
ncbi:MoaB/Mog domain-containing protein [Pterulicium gracile]|uniref:MoaB/Mog domain-containing protein n=1 Tax=Pterulicium gracile TaxID=1884261 RepID=A0A5C3QDL4_9AGAR|nr:MoaB/Mog domain-containing protein [Pterula gracilis]